MRALQFLFHAAVTTLKMGVGAVVSALWRLNVHGTIMARLFDVAELGSFWCSTTQSCPKLSKKGLSILCLCNNTFVRIWIFLSASFVKQVLEPFEPLERFGRGSE